MKLRKIKYLKACNILCFGPKGIEIKFENLGKITLIKGQNLDSIDNEIDAKDSSNGAGKSSIADIISYGIYGKPIKKAKKFTQFDMIHNQTDKSGLYVEIIIDNYRIVRTRKLRKTNDYGTLDLWHSEEGIWNEETKITQAKKGTIQDKIITDVIGLNYETFINIFIFGDDISNSFLECDSGDKREIVENLLSLEKYREYFESAKEYHKNLKDSIKLLKNDYEILAIELDSHKKRMEKITFQESEWNNKIIKDIEIIKNNILTVTNKLNKSDVTLEINSYKDAQEELELIKLENKKNNDKKEKLINISEDLINRNKSNDLKLESYNKDLISINQSINTLENQIKNKNKIILDNGEKCTACNSYINIDRQSELLEECKEFIDKAKINLDDLIKNKEITSNKIIQYSENKNKFNKAIKECNLKLSEVEKLINQSFKRSLELSKIKEPQIEVEHAVLNEKLINYKKILAEKIQEKSPYSTILISCQEELQNKEKECQIKKEEIKKTEKELPYYEFWTKAFGDSGIRKYIIDGIIPILNNRISYWLHTLVNGKIKLTFDNTLSETIDRFPFDGRKYTYHGLSNGQRRRLILALSQSFAHVMMVSSGSSLSLIILDEVTMNMDKTGIDSIYKMICELSKDKQLFIIDHNEKLIKLLNGNKTINLQMKNGQTSVVDSI